MIALQSSMMMLIVELTTLSVLSHHVESVTYSVKLHNGALMPLLPRDGHFSIDDIDKDLENQHRHFFVYDYGTKLGKVMHEWVSPGKLNYESIFITVMEMEAQVRAGKAKAIGLAGYKRGEKIDRIIKNSTILPAVVTITVWDYWEDKSFSDYLANLGIATIVHNWFIRPRNGKIQDIAKRLNLSADEIYLRYFTQQSITIIADLDVGFLKAFEFNLSKEDIDTIKSMSFGELEGDDH